MGLLGLLCTASHATGEPMVERICAQPATGIRHLPIDEFWSVTVNLCGPHTELWDETHPAVVSEGAHGRQ